MTKEFINAALAGIFSRAAQFMNGAHDSDTQRLITAEAKRVADQVIGLYEPRAASNQSIPDPSKGAAIVDPR